MTLSLCRGGLENNGANSELEANPLPLPPHLNFFSFPAEVRNMIYRFLLIHPSSIEVAWGALAQVQRAYSKATEKAKPQSGWLESILQSSNENEGQVVRKKCRYDSSIYQSGLPLQVFAVNHQIHEEAYPLLFSENSFQFSMGGTINAMPYKIKRRCRYWLPNSAFKYPTTTFPSKGLRLIRRCEVHIAGEPLSMSGENQRTVYLALRDDIAAFAAGFADPDEIGKKHCLQLLELVYTNGMLWWRGCRENVLEPLGMIHGVERVATKGVTKLMSTRLEAAIRSQTSRCVPKKEEELWLVQLVRRKKWTKVCLDFSLTA